MGLAVCLCPDGGFYLRGALGEEDLRRDLAYVDCRWFPPLMALRLRRHHLAVDHLKQLHRVDAQLSTQPGPQVAHKAQIWLLNS
jgi:hypothetical protein